LTAASELFVTENVRDEVQAILNKRYPNKYPNINIEPPKEWADTIDSGTNNPAEYPDAGEAKLYQDGSDESIGTVTWNVKFMVEGGAADRYIVAEPKDVEVKLTGVEDKLPEWEVHYSGDGSKVVHAPTSEEAFAIVANMSSEELVDGLSSGFAIGDVDPVEDTGEE
jgi:hypothetical protein